MTDCPHDRTTLVKRARETVGWPDAWANAIIEQCVACGEYLIP